MLPKIMIPANRRPSYLIPQSEEHLYHIMFTERMATYNPEKFIEREMVQTFTREGFAGYLKNKRHFSFANEQILHDPTIEIVAVKEPNGEAKGETIPLPKARAIKTSNKPKNKK